MMFVFFTIVIILSATTVCTAAAADDDDADAAADNTTTPVVATNTTGIAQNRTSKNNKNVNNMVILESAKVTKIVVNDSNFKMLVRHCLQSTNPTACNDMKRWDTSNVTDFSWLLWEELSSSSTSFSSFAAGANQEEVNNHDDEDRVLLKGAVTFNIDISSWNTSSATTMKSM